MINTLITIKSNNLVFLLFINHTMFKLLVLIILLFLKSFILLFKMYYHSSILLFVSCNNFLFYHDFITVRKNESKSNCINIDDNYINA